MVKFETSLHIKFKKIEHDKKQLKNKLIFNKSYFGGILNNKMSRNTTYIHEDSKGKLHDYDVVYSIDNNNDINIESVSEEGLEVEYNEITDKIKDVILTNQD